MKLKNTIKFSLSLLILFVAGCGDTPDENPIKSDNVILHTNTGDVKSDKIPTATAISMSDPDETIEADMVLLDTPLFVSTLQGSVYMDDAGEAVRVDLYRMNEATITGDTLTVNVSYTGGCETHEFTLIAAESFSGSDSVTIDISLAHNSNGDRCRKWLTEDYHFNLEPIKALYQEVYQQNSGTIILRLDDVPNELEEIAYEFDS